MVGAASSRPPRRAWWSRTRGLPADAYARWAASLSGGPARILAWAATPDGFCVGSPAQLSVSEGEEWRHLGWHRIERGGWDATARELSWTEVAERGERGVRGAVALTEPGRLPELFRERVSATIAVQRYVPLTSASRGVVVTARRDLAPGGSISWHTTLSTGLDGTDTGVRAAVDDAVAELRAEYDLR